MLKQVQRLPYGSNLLEHNQVVDTISMKNPVEIIDNDCVVIAGSGLLNVFDRLRSGIFRNLYPAKAKQLGEPDTITPKR